jgi:hypothetical protein
MLHHGGMWKEEISGEGCCITEECGRKRLVSECLLHQRCNTGECGMWKEEISERIFVASTMHRTRVSRLERCCISPSGMREGRG